jgi:hypothetical protein
LASAAARISSLLQTSLVQAPHIAPLVSASRTTCVRRSWIAAAEAAPRRAGSRSGGSNNSGCFPTLPLAEPAQLFRRDEHPRRVSRPGAVFPQEKPRSSEEAGAKGNGRMWGTSAR